MTGIEESHKVLEVGVISCVLLNELGVVFADHNDAFRAYRGMARRAFKVGQAKTVTRPERSAERTTKRPVVAPILHVSNGVMVLTC